MRDEVVIKGAVITGMGEGQYYVTQAGYVEQFTEKLGFTPYEGTLNVKVAASAAAQGPDRPQGQAHVVKGFERNGRTFGDVECHKATIQNIECAVVMPSRSHYDDVLEILCKYHLRRTLGIERRRRGRGPGQPALIQAFFRTWSTTDSKMARPSPAPERVVLGAGEVGMGVAVHHPLRDGASCPARSRQGCICPLCSRASRWGTRDTRHSRRRGPT